MKTFKQFVLTEAPLSQKTTDGSQRKWDRIKSEIGKVIFNMEKEGLLMDEFGQALDQISKGESLKITSTEEKEINNSSAVKVKLNSGEEGWVHLSKIRNPGPSSTTNDEDIALEQIKTKFNSAIQENGPIVLYLDEKHRMENVVNIVQPDGDPKADFAVLNSRDQGVGFISHKKGGGAKAFQQYGGITERSGIKKYGTNEMIEEIDKFILAVKEYTIKHPRHEIPSRLYRFIESEDLIRFSVYGRNFNQDFGLEHCNIIGQGTPIFEEYSDGYNLTFADEVHHSPDISWAKERDEFRATLIARFTNGRKLEGLKEKVRVDNFRGMIAPYALLSNNSVEI